VDKTVREIYRERIFFSFLAGLAIATITAVWTWITIRPLFRLTNTVRQILKGHTEARAKIRTGDEIEDLAEAFNEMVSRLQQSLKNLRARSEALEESEERYRVLVENASDIIWLLSPEGKIVFVSQGFSGLTRETLLKEGLPLFLSFHTDESIQKFEAAIEQVKKAKTPVYHLTTVYHHPVTRSEVFYSTNLTPVLTRAGELKAIQAVSRDVTELKRIEMMKDRLIRDVAHELKTPVAKFQMTLKWLEQEMQKQKGGERYQDVLDLMKRNADLLMSIIMEVMDLSRLESGTERLIRRPCDLNQILNRVLDDLEPFVREKKLKLEKKLSAEPLPFEGDEEMLYRLFSNLVANAVKFTTEGKIEVNSSKNQKMLRAMVSDTGVGLEKEDLTKVFDRFYQKTPATQGMGVGLALAREIAILHDGDIWAESAGLGKGSTFIVEFPR
jgi:PAS domain S-box-containing protein